MSDNLQKMAMALADVENELIRKRGGAIDDDAGEAMPSDDFADIFDDQDDDSFDEDDSLDD